MRKQRSYAEVYNDIWDIVVNVFQVLRNTDLANELIWQIEMTPFSRSEFESCGDQEIAEITNPVERARRTIYRSFSGFGSASTNALHSTGFRSNSTRSGTTPAHDWANYPKIVQSFIARLQGVVIENRNYQNIIDQQDSAETFFYLDPPYVHKTRNLKRGNACYRHEFTDKDHVEMCERINRIKGTAVVSGYENEIYKAMLKDWEMVKKETYADGAKRREEVLWLCPKLSII